MVELALALALAIMGVLASVAALSLRSSVAHSRLQQAVNRLSSDLILVRAQPRAADARPASPNCKPETMTCGKTALYREMESLL